MEWVWCGVERADRSSHTPHTGRHVALPSAPAQPGVDRGSGAGQQSPLVCPSCPVMGMRGAVAYGIHEQPTGS